MDGDADRKGKSDPEAIPLPGDPKRQAVSSLSGYDYQIWRTIEVWLSIGERDSLFLEGAEDFDLVTANGSAVTTQVKSSPASLSLASEEALDAITHFIELRSKTNAPVRFVFLSRGGFALERGIGKNPGVMLWQKASAGNEGDADLLRTFLLKALKSRPVATDFLAARTAAELMRDLFQGIEWLCEQPDTPLVKLSIRNSLISFGQQLGYPASISAGAIDHLHSRCWEVIQRPKLMDRKLTREDFLAVFDDATSVKVPLKGSILDALAGQILQSRAEGAALVLSKAPEYWMEEIPPLPIPSLPRQEQIKEVLAAFESDRVSLLTGSSGKGKTTIAKLVALQSRRPCIWIQLSGRPPEFVEVAMASAASELTTARIPRTVVVDDFPADPGVNQPIWTSLELLNRARVITGSRLVITTKAVPPERVDSRLIALGISICNIPDLTESEVEQLLRELGCPTDGRMKIWARATFVHTSGHPKLASVRSLDLRERGWPNPTAADLVVTPSSVQGQRMAERLEVAERLKGAELDFLYVLTLAGRPFDREFAVIVGTAINIADPGSAFDRLVGRWIDTEAANNFSVTSLLAGEGARALPEEKIKEAYTRLFDASLARQPINISSVLQVLMYAYLAQDGRRLTRFILGLISSEEAVQPHVFRELRPLVFFGTGKEKFAVPFDSNASLLFRMLQFKVADQEASEELPRICDQWDWEISTEPGGVPTEAVRLIRAVTICASMAKSIPASTTVRALADISHAIDAGLDFPVVELPEEIVSRADPAPKDPIVILSSAFQERCRSVQYLEELLVSLQSLDDPLRKRILAAADLPFFDDSSFLVEPAWIGETQKPDPDWRHVIEVLRHAETVAADWRSRSLGLGAARCISIVCDEHLGDRSGAFAAIEHAVGIFGSAPILDSQRANIHYQHDEYEKALETWNACLANDDAPADKVRDPLAFRKAALSAAKLGDLSQSARLFYTGAHWAAAAGLPSFQAGLLFDSALAAYKAGELNLFNSALVAGLRRIRGKLDPEHDFRMFARQKLAGHAVLWILEQLYHRGREHELTEPAPGVCSNPSLPETISTLGPSPFELTLAHAIEIEHRMRLPLLAADEFAPEMKACLIPGMKIKIAEVNVQQAFRRRDFSELLVHLSSFVDALGQLRAQRRLGQNVMEAFQSTVGPEDRAVNVGFQNFLLCALTVEKLLGSDTSALIGRWKSETGIPRDLTSLLDELVGLLSAEPERAVEVVRDQKQSPLSRLAAAHFLITSSPSSPPATAYSQAAFLLWLSHPPVGEAIRECLDVFASAFAEAWQIHLQHPALLQSPRISAQYLREAIRSIGTPALKLRALLEAASFATGVKLPHELNEWLVADG